jgi:hypothetical protein
MTTPDNSTKRFGDITIEFDHDCDDAVSASLTMLAYNLSMLVAKERYARLGEIEAGALRSAVAGFVTARMLRSPFPQAKPAKSNGAAT